VSTRIDFHLELALGDFRLAAEAAAPASGVTAVFGPSGSGKSSLLRCLAGLEPGARGRIEVAGEVWLDSARGICRPPHRRGVGVVFQDSALFSHLSVRRNLEYGLRRTPLQRRSFAFDDAVEGLGVGPLLERRTDRLSGGERQRVAIARALLTGPRLLLLDEPLASLDLPARAEILELLRRLLRSTPLPVFYVTHSRSEAVQLAEHVVLLAAGRVHASGPLREIALRTDAVAFGNPDEIGAVVDAEVSAVDAPGGLSLLSFGGGRLVVPGLLAPGERRRLEIRARDVSLALDEPRRTSILNVLAGRVVEVRDPRSEQPVVAVDVGGSRLLARISRRSLVQLGIAPGLAVYAQIKAIAVSA
jgi:molybdate transport system ATP-binding protein